MQTLHVYVVDVESITLRSVAGDGDQADLLVRTRGGTLTLRLLPRAGRALRLLDLRRRDKLGRRRARGRFVDLPLAAPAIGR
jgi:hypothetical protein